MKKLFAVITLILGIWLCISPWILGYSGSPAQWEDGITGVLIGAFSLYVLVCKKESVSPNWPFFVNSLLGGWLIIFGFLVFGQISIAGRLNDIIIGVLVVALSLFATQLIENKRVFAYTKDGGILLEMVQIFYKDGIIIVKGKTFGTMPVIMQLKPMDVWNLLGLIPLGIVTHLPGILASGWKKSKEASNLISFKKRQ
ncbi:SPW repeat protein [Desulfobacter sp.]|uniref:SPW repeat protein n=1 Tax=Desulfobacter sp. TaxID=2294 RepID=UPI003D09BEB3